MSDMGADPDGPAVLDLLRGVADSSGDPDVELAALLLELASRGFSQIDEILTRLVRDAHRD